MTIPVRLRMTERAGNPRKGGRRTGEKARRNEGEAPQVRACAAADAAALFRLAAEEERPPTPPDSGLEFDEGWLGAVLLLGLPGPIGAGVRRAQEACRLDRRPSYWSQAALLASPLKPLGRTRRPPIVFESSLEPDPQYNAVADHFGVSPRSLSDYGSAPNAALVEFALTAAERRRLLDAACDPVRLGISVELGPLMAKWLAFLNGRGAAPNPLTVGAGEHSAAYVQAAYGAIGVDLCPGQDPRQPSPEAVWQAVRRFGDRYVAFDEKTGAGRPRPMRAVYVVHDRAAEAFSDDPPTDLYSAAGLARPD